MAVTRCALAAVLGGLLLAAPLTAQTATGIVTGRVLDSASRQPLAAVSVRIVGSANGALTRNDGSFTIAVVSAGLHQVRGNRIGFGPQTREVTVPAGGTISVEFALAPQAAVLSDIVVTGYGTQRRESITGSVATVNAEEANVGVVTNANVMLQGRVAGVQITTNNGEPGGGAQVRIRGGTSIQASNTPLYVVDGVPLQNETSVASAMTPGVNSALSRSPLNAINPNDIESMTVLKDASATAIYGSRGANGVVLIQTKRGSRGTSGLDYDTYVAASSAARRLQFLTGDQYRSFVQDQVAAKNLPASQLALLGTANTDWEKELTHTGYSSSHNMAFSGGSQQTHYRASLNYFDQKGVVISNGLKRYQGRLNAQHAALEGRVNLDLNLTASRVNNAYLAMENGGGFTGGVFTNMAIYNPTFPVRVTDTVSNTPTYYEMGPGTGEPRARQHHRNGDADAEPDGADDPRCGLHELRAPDLRPAHQPAGRGIQRSRQAGRTQPAKSQLPATAHRDTEVQRPAGARDRGWIRVQPVREQRLRSRHAGVHHRPVPVQQFQRGNAGQLTGADLLHPGEPARLLLLARQLRVRRQVLPDWGCPPRRLFASGGGAQVVGLPRALGLVAGE
jgi:iron complex outermembrane receptor protein